MQILFVGGPPRCGGTLLNNILCSDKTSNPLLRETHYFRELVQLYLRSKGTCSSLEEGHYFPDETSLREFSSRHAQQFMELISERYHDAETIVLKSISLTLMFSVVHELLPTARYMVVVRDPRDTITSQLEVGLRQEREGKRNQFPRDIQNLAREYLRYYGASANTGNTAFQRHVLYVKYEDLVRNPLQQVEVLRRFTGLELLEFNPEKQWSKTERSLENEDSSNSTFNSSLWGKPISDSHIGHYKAMLDESEIKVIEHICKPVMGAFDYS